MVFHTREDRAPLPPSPKTITNLKYIESEMPPAPSLATANSCNPRQFLEVPLYVSHVGKSMYAMQLERWFDLFGRENFKVCVCEGKERRGMLVGLVSMQMFSYVGCLSFGHGNLARCCRWLTEKRLFACGCCRAVDDARYLKSILARFLFLGQEWPGCCMCFWCRRTFWRSASFAAPSVREVLYFYVVPEPYCPSVDRGEQHRLVSEIHSVPTRMGGW